MRNNQRRAGQKPESAPISSVPTAHQPAPLAFSAPTEFVELPSRGEFYPEDHPFYKQEAIEIRFMTAKDEDILTSEALLKKNLAIDRLIENLVVEDIDTSSLLIGDRNAILIAARASAYGSDYEVTIRCEACSATAEANFDLKTARVQENCFDKEFLRENAISFNRETGTFDLSLFLVKVDGHMDYDSVMNFIDVMPAADSKFLRGLFPKLTPSVQLIKSHRCESCYTLKDMEVPLSAEFFWPK